jgi:hypothetical protein
MFRQEPGRRKPALIRAEPGPALDGGGPGDRLMTGAGEAGLTQGPFLPHLSRLLESGQISGLLWRIRLVGYLSGIDPHY